MAEYNTAKIEIWIKSEKDISKEKIETLMQEFKSFAEKKGFNVPLKFGGVNPSSSIYQD